MQCTQIGRRFDQHAIAGIDEQFADQIESLLRSGSNEDVFRFRFNSVARDVARDHFAERFVTFGGAILQGEVRFLLQNFLAGFLKTLGRKNFRRRQSAGERDHFGALRELEELADCRALESLCALRIARRPGGRHGLIALPHHAT